MSIERGMFAADAPERKDRFLLGHRKSVDAAKRLASFVASTDEVDRQGEIIHPGAFARDRDRFLAGHSPMLASHLGRLQNGDPPQIATVTEMTVAEHQVSFDAVYAETNLANEHWKLVRDPTQKVAVSVGFDPTGFARGTVAEIRKEFPELRESLAASGLADSDRMIVYTLLELYEISQVAVPANRGAIQLAAKALEEKLATAAPKGGDGTGLMDGFTQAARAAIKEELRAFRQMEFQPLFDEFAQRLLMEFEQIKASLNENSAAGRPGAEGSAPRQASPGKAAQEPDLTELTRRGAEFLAELAKLKPQSQ